MSNRNANHAERREDGGADLRQMEKYPGNRQQRRRAVKAAGADPNDHFGPQTLQERWRHTNEYLPKRKPVFLGINQFKRATRDPYMKAVYKQNAWASFWAMIRREREKLQPKRQSLKDILHLNG